MTFFFFLLMTRLIFIFDRSVLLCSQLLLVALLSWTVCCFPARGGSGQSLPYRDVDPGFPPPPTNIHDPTVSYLVDQRHPPPSFPPPPTDINDPTVSYLVDRQNPPGFPPPSSNLNGPGVSYLVDGPVTSSSADVEPGPGILPVPPVHQAGELERFEGNVEHGNSERETEELGILPPPPHLERIYQGGELSSYASSFEHGNSESESQNQGFRPGPPFGGAELQSGFTVGGGLVQSLPRPWRPSPPGDFYLFLTGQLPPGTLSHFRTEYEAGRDHWNSDHYEKHNIQISENPDTPGDGVQQQIRYFPTV
ncbi:uncharacterized protein LOC110952679 [Acanthochromis polyacanthus]|uniref:uncharacterized protein LOC110952679 n=1 Tax=Acanthochromis polyacanthus TaxID=80966 RepID=UPI0022349558|nr:uncharacterized protein LOC110952679 [Acanthochromis polyacanthus]